MNGIQDINIASSRSVWVKINDSIFCYMNENIDFNKLKKYELLSDIKYNLYANDFRFTKCDYNSRETYLALGCSFVFGVGVQDEEILPYYFSKLHNFEKNIINCGVPGHSSNMALNILYNKSFKNLMKDNSKIKHCFYSLIEDHIYRNFRYESKGQCIDGYLYKNNKKYIPTVVGKIKYIFKRSYIFRKIFLPIIDECCEQYYRNYMVSSLQEMKKIIEENYKSKLTVIVWPEFDDKFINQLKLANLDLIFLPEKFNSKEEGYRIKYDGHPTGKANKEIAEILYNHINKIDNKNKEN